MALNANRLGAAWKLIEDDYNEKDIVDLNAARLEINERKAQALIDELNNYGVVIPNTLANSGGTLTGTGKIQ